MTDVWELGMTARYGTGRPFTPLAGTAPRGDRWFLVESAVGWGRHAFLDPPADSTMFWRGM